MCNSLWMQPRNLLSRRAQWSSVLPGPFRVWRRYPMMLVA